jgi:hypothetical protein
VSRVPRVELLFWDGCPSHPRALADLREAVAAAGLDPGAIEVREVPDQAAARREGFPGSPTIRVDGRDIAPAAGDPVMLACRVYRRRDGRVSPVPDPDDLRAALAAALAEGAP